MELHCDVLFGKFTWVQSVFRSHDLPCVADIQGTEHALRYLSLHDNQYVRYFKGHSARVSAVAMSPKNDLFMSAAEVWRCAVSAHVGCCRGQ